MAPLSMERLRRLEGRLGFTWKLVLHVVAVLIALAATLTWFSIAGERALLLDELRLRHSAQTNYWIQNNLVSLISPDAVTVEPLTKELHASGDVAYIVLYDAQGKPLLTTGPDAANAPTRSIDPHRLNGHAPTLDSVVSGGDEFHELVLPIALPQSMSGASGGLGEFNDLLAKPTQPAQADVVGAVRLGISAASVNAKMRPIRNRSVGLAAGIVVLALGLSYGLLRHSTRPIKDMARQATAIANGNFERTPELLTIRSQDEIGELAANFHSMAVRLKESRDALEQFNRELEQRVQDRTNELQSSYKRLEDANRRLRELDELKSNFLSTVSHELRTPLTSIKAFAEILLDNQGEDHDTQVHFLEIINSESERLARLIGDLLDLAKIESGTVKWKMEMLDLRQVIERSKDAVSSLATKHKLTIVENVPPSVPRVYADRDKLVQLVTNLLSNAIKFTNEDAHIEVGVRATKGIRGEVVDTERREGFDESHFLEVWVKDNGIGIPPEHLSKIFDKFHQVDSHGTRQRGGGTGLGLAISREIIEHHKGELWVESEVNRGSTFKFAVPVAVATGAADDESPAETAVAPSAAPDVRRRQKVLVVDDEPNIREFLKYELVSDGYDVLEASNGEEAMEIARREHPSVITLDVMMPGLDGFDILSLLNGDARTADIPVILISVVDDAEKGFRLGAVDYLVKPIDRHDFMESVHRVSARLDGSPSRKVLVVDDDPAIAEAMQTILRAEGFEVLVAGDGETAIASVLAHGPDLVLLDLKLPDISGYEVMQRLKATEASKSTPIVVMTASDLGRGRATTLALGASEYLTKPFPRDKFLEILKGLLAQSTPHA